MTRRRLGVVHAIFDCKDCGKHWSNHLTAKKKARQHHSITGHEITGEEGIAFLFIRVKKQ